MQPAEVFLKKAFLKKFNKFKGKHLCWSLYIVNAFYTIDQNINTRNHVWLIQEHQKAFIKKGKKIKKENKKVANRKLGKVRNLGNLGKVIPSFLISEF